MNAGKALAVFLCVVFPACSGPPEPPAPPADLSHAVAVVGYLASSRYINVSMYSATAETGAPSEFISYLFSSMGAAERPPSARDEEAGGGGQRGGPPSWPMTRAAWSSPKDISTPRENRCCAANSKWQDRPASASGQLPTLSPDVVTNSISSTLPKNIEHGPL
jgi:hypothetical protein